MSTLLAKFASPVCSSLVALVVHSCDVAVAMLSFCMSEHTDFSVLSSSCISVAGQDIMQRFAQSCQVLDPFIYVSRPVPEPSSKFGVPGVVKAKISFATGRILCIISAWSIAKFSVVPALLQCHLHFMRQFQKGV